MVGLGLQEDTPMSEDLIVLILLSIKWMDTKGGARLVVGGRRPLKNDTVLLHADWTRCNKDVTKWARIIEKGVPKGLSICWWIMV